MKRVEVSEESIEQYLYIKLQEYGYAAGQTEVEDLAEMMFDYLLDKAVVELIDEE